MLSHQQSRNDINGKKTIILNPTLEQKNGTDVVTFDEGVTRLRFIKLMIGNIFAGYPCINRHWPCTSYDVSYNDLRKDRIKISS